MITTFNNSATDKPFQNSSYLQATLALPGTSTAAPESTDHNANTFSTKSNNMSKITMDDIKTQIHSVVNTTVSESFSAFTNNMQKYVVDMNAKVQLER